MKPTARKEGLILQEVEEELVVYDTDQHHGHRLNRTAALVWHHCDGQKTVEDLVAMLQQELNPEADTDLVWLTLDRLQSAHLLEESPARPTDQTRASRRRFVRKVGLVGVLSLLLPVVETITAPTPAHAVSGPPPTCGQCESASFQCPPCL